MRTKSKTTRLRKKLERELDQLIARYVKKRDQNRCRRCNTYYPDGSSGLHAAHIMSRVRKRTRWRGENIIALCFTCHLRWWHVHPIEAAAWIRKLLGDEWIDNLIVYSKETNKWTLADLQQERNKLEEIVSNPTL